MDNFNRFREKYHRSIILKLLFIILCVAVMVACAAISITIGPYNITMMEVYETIYNHLIGKSFEIYSLEWYNDEIIWNSRMPRVVFAIVAGAALAVAGTAMQGVMKNPLAEPYTTGVSAGAYLGISLSMCLGLTLAASGEVFSAFIFALIPVAIIAASSSRTGNSVATIILLGTALTYMFNAVSTFVLVSSDTETLAEVYKWQVGSMNGVTWDQTWTAVAITVVGLLIIGFLSKKLNILALGDENAKSLGLNVTAIRVLCLVVMAVMVSVIVVYTGIIGFVGLICPHMIRLVIGSDNRFVLPAAAAFGAAFLLLADTIAKYFSSFDAIPVGAVASLIGAPVFMIILIHNRRGIW